MVMPSCEIEMTCEAFASALGGGEDRYVIIHVVYVPMLIAQSVSYVLQTDSQRLFFFLLHKSRSTSKMDSIKVAFVHYISY